MKTACASISYIVINILFRIEQPCTGIVSKDDLATIVADSSENFIKQNKLCVGKFAWQNTASAFSVSKDDVDKVCKYILNQREHHRKISFAEEYELFLKFYRKGLGYQK